MESDQTFLDRPAAGQFVANRPSPFFPVSTAFAVAILASGIALLRLSPLGPLAHHMSLHILLMNVVAPLMAVTVAAERPRLAGFIGSGTALAAASATQIALLWAAHVPAIVERTMASPALGAGLSAVLFVSALVFWTSVIAQRGAKSWRALTALILTGKVFCLLAALLVFAPRLLYPGSAHGGGSMPVSTLADQQLSGLLMVSICPLTYIAAAIAIAARWLGELGTRDAVSQLRYA